jgi:hypothetical protein
MAVRELCGCQVCSAGAVFGKLKERTPLMPAANMIECSRLTIGLLSLGQQPAKCVGGVHCSARKSAPLPSQMNLFPVDSTLSGACTCNMCMCMCMHM